MRLYQPLLTLTAAGLAKINQQAMEVPIFGSIGRLAEIKDKNKNDEIALERHNLYRKRHVDTPSLVFDPLLCDAAQASANSIAAQRSLIHNFDDLKAHSHGENLGMQWSEPNPPPVNYSATIDAWYLDEIGLYDYTNPGFSIPTSHFTQVVWKLTTSFCMRHAFSDDGLQLYYAARYVERGNRLKLFSKNVMPLKTVEDQEHFDQIFVDGISELAKQDTTAGPGGSGDDTTSTTIPVTTSTFPTVTTTACPCGFESLGLATGGCVLTGAGEPCDGTSTSALATSTSTLPTTTSNTSQTLTSPVVTSTTLPVTSTASTTSATQTTSASVNASSTGTSTTMPIALSTTPTVPTTAAGTSTSAATSTAQTTTNSTQVTTTTSQITTTTTQATNTTTQAITMTTQASSTTSTQATTTLKTTSTTKASTTTQSTTQASTTIKRTTPSGDISSIISALPASKQVAGQDLAQEKPLPRQTQNLVKLNDGFVEVFDWMFGENSKFKPADPEKVNKIRGRFPGKNQKLVKRLEKCEANDFGKSDFARAKFSSNPKVAMEQVVVMYRNWIEANLSKCEAPFKGIAKRKHLINRIKRWKDFLLIKFCRFVDPSRKFCKA